MGRSVTTRLAGQLNNPITNVGYLVRWNMDAPLLWSSIGAVTWNGMIFSDQDFTLDGLSQDPDVDFTATMNVQNIDLAFGSLVTVAFMPDVTVDIWQFERGALGILDVPKLCRLACGPISFDYKQAQISLINQPSYSSWAPRRRVDPTFGFNYSVPANSQLAWENEILIIQGENNVDG